ncbi:fungal-specific transcription factor domain-containing protein [Lentinula aciculospora]|uniref:Fungal-specific transcription factor domain-containing protein n=1 Tax=Lentinula aciculospora TaxID=153920 RepID=A0A9W9AFX3_9AGAR|nr:fungal-specific transcription factor domain-containing protein [Lentinula aciculospora]
MNGKHTEPKRRRLQNACSRCRQRRVRCDSELMPNSICSGCLNAGVECTHNDTRKKRGPKSIPKSVIENHFEAAHTFVSCILAEPEAYPIPAGAGDIRALIVDISRYAYFLQKESSLQTQSSLKAKSTSIASTGSSLPATPLVANPPSLNVFASPYFDVKLSQTEDHAANEICERMEGLTIGRQYFGTSSSALLIHTALHFKREATGYKQDIHQNFRRPEFWHIYPWQRDPRINIRSTFTFPEDDLLHNLIDNYFVHFEPYIPLLHRPTFEKLVAEGLHLLDVGFGQVVLAVCAVASRCGNDPRNKPEGIDLEHSLGWRWYSQISLNPFSLIETPRLYDLQLCVLTVIYLQASAISETSWFVLGIAMRLAQANGVHRKQPGQARTIERELWIRAFWAIIVYDINTSMFLGRPRVTTMDDFDIELPIDCDQEFWDTTTETDMFVQPPDRPSKTSFWIHLIRLMEIAGLACKLIYPIRKTEWPKILGVEEISFNQKTVMELDSALNAWVSSIPDHVKWDPKQADTTLLLQSVTLYTSYYWVQIQVHKKFIPGPGQDNVLHGFPSMAICANAARTCIRIAEACDLSQRAPTILPSVFISATMLLINFWRENRTNVSLSSRTELRDVRKCFELARPFETRFQKIGRMIDILNGIICVGHIDVPSESPSSMHSTNGWVANPNSEISPELVGYPSSSLDTIDPQHFPDQGREETREVNHIPQPSLPLYSNELGLLNLCASNSTTPQLAGSNTLSAFPRYTGSYISSEHMRDSAGSSLFGVNVNPAPFFVSSGDENAVINSQSGPNESGAFISAWGHNTANHSNQAHENPENGPDEDWTLLMQNIDNLLQSTADFGMFVDAP